MKLAKLEQVFFTQNAHLVEVLHKQRGYGIVVISVAGGLTFGIPLRSHIKHGACFRTVGDAGLDYSKALMITDPAHLGGSFKIPPNEYVKIADREIFITQRFEKYVEKYISGVRKNDANILREYQYSTLQNYHVELQV